MTDLPSRSRNLLRAALPALLGLAMGLTVGLIWWFTWGCHVCDPGGAPEARVVFAAVAGAVTGQLFFRID